MSNKIFNLLSIYIFDFSIFLLFLYIQSNTEHRFLYLSNKYCRAAAKDLDSQIKPLISSEPLDPGLRPESELWISL